MGGMGDQIGVGSEQSYSERWRAFESVRQTRPLRPDEMEEYRLLWLLAGIERIRDHAEQFSGAELAADLGLDGRQIGARLRELVKQGYIRAVGIRGVWTTAGCRS